MLKLVAMGIAGCVLAAALIVAAVKNPYLRPRAEKPESIITTQSAPVAKPPAVIVADAKNSASDRATPAQTVTRQHPTTASQPETQARPSASIGFSAHAGTIDPNKREGASVKLAPVPPPPAPAPAPKLAEKTNPAQKAADHLLVASLPLPPSPQAAARVRQQALAVERKVAKPPPPKKTQKKSPREQAKQFPPSAAQKQERPKQANTLRVISPRENPGFTPVPSPARNNFLNVPSNSGVLIIYGTQPSTAMADGPVIIRLR